MHTDSGRETNAAIAANDDAAARRATFRVLTQDAGFQHRYARRERVRWALAAVAFGIAAGFSALLIWGRSLVMAPIGADSHITWGLVATVACLVLGPCVSGIYVFVAERFLDDRSTPTGVRR